jgi:putative hydrolase of HD superfamily
MKKKKVTLTKYFLSAKRFEDVKRYATQDPVLHQSDSEHAFFMILMARKLFKELNLDLDYAKVIDLILFHDFSEIGLKEDYEATRAQSDPAYRREKELFEKRNIKKVTKDLDDPDIKSAYDEYNADETREAKFVKALDKIESAIHKTARHREDITDDLGFTASYPNEYVADFAELVPFWAEFQAHMKKQFAAKDCEWKDEYNIENNLEKTK